MFCDEVLERVEAIAAGEEPVDERLAAHLRSCPGCTMVLDEAARLERLLKGRPVPVLPAHFAARTLTRVRRERWRSERFVDTLFNVSLGLVMLALVAALWLMVGGSGLSAVTRGLPGGISHQLADLTVRMAPSLGRYAGAAALIGAALGLWWWAERE